jgi:hypothetical protein
MPRSEMRPRLHSRQTVPRPRRSRAEHAHTETARAVGRLAHQRTNPVLVLLGSKRCRTAGAVLTLLLALLFGGTGAMAGPIPGTAPDDAEGGRAGKQSTVWWSGDVNLVQGMDVAGVERSCGAEQGSAVTSRPSCTTASPRESVEAQTATAAPGYGYLVQFSPQTPSATAMILIALVSLTASALILVLRGDTSAR